MSLRSKMFTIHTIAEAEALSPGDVAISTDSDPDMVRAFVKESSGDWLQTGDERDVSYPTLPALVIRHTLQGDTA